MIHFLKQLAKNGIILFSRILSKTRIGQFYGEAVIENVMNRENIVMHNNIEMKFSVPNQLNHFRVNTFSDKEPETLEWIDSIPNNSILWDIGANIGLYSIYAAKAKNCHVFAFEPSVYNLELLARNIYLNNLQDQITVIPLALSDKMGSDIMRLTTTEWGGGAFHIWKRDRIGWQTH